MAHDGGGAETVHAVGQVPRGSHLIAGDAPQLLWNEALDGAHETVRARSAQERLDELKRQLAMAVVREFSPREIRAQSLANLYRWKLQGTWVSAYEEWQEILESDSDGALFAAMLGRDEQSNRLRQSLPFVGLLSQEQVREIYEEAGG